MITLKAGVGLADLTPQAVLAVLVAASAFAEADVADLVLTSVNDGDHADAPRGKHPSGEAVDIRLHNVPDAQRGPLVAKIRAALGDNYDVLLEGVGTPNLHLHVEHDPKVARRAT